MRTVDLVRHHIPAVLEMYGMPPITGGRHYAGECPMCGGKGKFRIDNKDNSGSWVCVCGAGDIWKLLIETTGKDFKTLANEIDRQFGNEYKTEARQTPKTTERSKLTAVMARVKSSGRICESNVAEYLNARGIFTLPTKGVFASNGSMLAIAVDRLGNPVYSHETFLDGSQKANITVQKKQTLLATENTVIEQAAIRLFEPASTLGIAEGIETALSASQIYKCATWATMTSGFMKKFKAPSGVNHLIIFADNDRMGTGLAAAFACGESNLKYNNDVSKVSIRWPVSVADFNDMITNGSEVAEWVLTKKGD